MTTKELQDRLKAASMRRGVNVHKCEPDDDGIEADHDAYGVGDRYYVSFPRDYHGRTQVSVYDVESDEGVGGIELAERLLAIELQAVAMGI